MKASESANSLTALNTDIENQKDQEDFLNCFICLEELNDKHEPLVPSCMLRTCGCVFKVHPECWNEWMKDKTQFDCPICRKKSLTSGKPPVPPIPIEAFPTERERNNRKYFYRGFFVAILLIIVALLVWKMSTE